MLSASFRLRMVEMAVIHTAQFSELQIHNSYAYRHAQVMRYSIFINAAQDVANIFI